MFNLIDFINDSISLLNSYYFNKNIEIFYCIVYCRCTNRYYIIFIIIYKDLKDRILGIKFLKSLGLSYVNTKYLIDVNKLTIKYISKNASKICL